MIETHVMRPLVVPPRDLAWLHGCVGHLAGVQGISGPPARRIHVAIEAGHAWTREIGKGDRVTVRVERVAVELPDRQAAAWLHGFLSAASAAQLSPLSSRVSARMLEALQQACPWVGDLDPADWKEL